jgi:cadmium resistance protein CadD (predicted permease)
MDADKTIIIMVFLLRIILFDLLAQYVSSSSHIFTHTSKSITFNALSIIGLGMSLDSWVSHASVSLFVT